MRPEELKKRLTLTLTLLGATWGAPLIAQEAESAAPQPQEQPKSQPESPAAPAPAAPPAPEAAKPAEPAQQPSRNEANILFQFDGMPYADVVVQFAQMAGKPILGDVVIDGQLTFFDARPYTYAEAMETLNLILENQGQMLIESDRYLRLVSLGDPTVPSRILVGGLEEAGDTKPGELVTVMLPVKNIDSESAAKAVVPMVSMAGRITPLARGNGILITDKIANIQRIRSLLTLLDQKADEEAKQGLKSYGLKTASAENAARVINTLLARDPRQAVVRPGQPVSTLTAAADSRTNVLMLRGSPDLITMAEQIIEMMESNADTGINVRVFGLENAAAQDVSNALLQMFGGRSGAQGVFIHGDTTMNSVLVRAGFEDMRNIEQMVQKLDTNVQELNNVRAFPLKKAGATSLASALQGVLVKRDARGNVTGGNVVITPDAATNTIYISGSSKVLDLAAKMLTELDQEPPTRQHDIHVLSLKDADAAALADTLTRMYTQRLGSNPIPGSMPIIQGVTSSNSLLISCSPEQWEVLKALIDQLKDVAVTVSVPVTRVVALQHANPAELAPLIQQIATAGQVTSTSRGAAVTPITVVAGTTRSLVIVAPENDQQRLSEVIKTLDIEATSEGADPIQTVTLQSADAVTLASTLMASIKPDPRNPNSVAITADAASNTVLIRAPQSQRKQLEELIARLDESAKLGAREMRTILLKHTSASALSPMLSQLYSSTATASRAVSRAAATQQVIIAPAPGDKTLVVDAPREQMEQIASLIAQLDQEGGPVSQQVRAYSLDKSQAQEMATMLARVFAPTVTGPGAPVPPRFDYNTASNQLIVAATTSEFPAIEKVIQDSDKGMTLVTQTRTFRLKFAKAAEVVTVLTAMLTEPAGSRSSKPLVRVGSLDATNDIVVQGPPDALQMAEQLIQTFDGPEARPQVAIEVVKLTNAQASSLAEAVASVVDARAQARSAAGGAQEEPVTVSPEPNSNSVIVRGPANRVPEVIEMIKRLDSQSDSGMTQLRIFPIKEGNAVELAPQLEQMFKSIIQQQTAQRKGLTPPPFTITADARTNSLVVSTTTGYFTLVEQLLKNLDQSTVVRSTVDVQVFALQNADELDVMSQINEMYTERTGEDKPVVNADYTAHTVSVIAKPADLATISEIIRKLDKQAEDFSIQFRVIPVDKKTPADELARTLQKIYTQTSGNKVKVEDKTSSDAVPVAPPDSGEPACQAEQTPEPAAEPSSAVPPTEVNIGVDKETNSLIISGTRKQLDELEDLIYTLSSETDGPDPGFRVFQLKHSSADEVAKIVNSLFNPQQANPLAGAAQQAQQLQQQMQQQLQQQLQQQFQQQVPQGLPFAIPGLPGAEGEAASRGGRTSGRGGVPQAGGAAQPAAPRVVVVPETRTGRVIVRASKGELDLIGRLIEEVDQVTTQAGEVRVFTLRNTRAEEVATNLRDLITVRTSGSGASRSVLLRGEIEKALKREGVIADDSVDMSTVISVAANTQTNSVIVASPAPAMRIIEQVISEIDQSAARDARPSVRFYKLKNAEAAVVLPTLQQILEPLSPSGSGPGAVTITADAASNMLIVAASPDQHELVDQVIQDFDGSQPGDAMSVKVYPISYAQASSVAQTLAEILIPGGRGTGGGRGGAIQWLRPGASEPGGGVSGALRMAADDSSNSLIVRATVEDHEKILGLIKELDIAPASQQQVRIIALKSADATRAAATLNRMFGGATGGRGGAFFQGPGGFGGLSAPGGGRQSVAIEGDSEARMLIVRADDATFKKIMEVVTNLDVPMAGGEASQRVIQLKHGVAPSVAEALAEAFKPAQGQTLPAEQRITVVAEQSSNSIVVTANETMHKKVDELLVTLDSESANTMETQFLILRNSDPATLAQALTRIAGDPTKGRGALVSSDEGTKSIIFKGPASEVNRLRKIASDLDFATSGGTPGVFIIPVKNNDAGQLAATVKDLFSQVAQQTLLTGGGGGSFPTLSVSSDPRSNSLVVVTDPTYMLMFKGIVDQIDNMTPARGALRVLTLKHADPSELQRAIEAIYGGGVPAQTQIQQPGQPGQPMQQSPAPGQFQQGPGQFQQAPGRGPGGQGGPGGRGGQFPGAPGQVPQQPQGQPQPGGAPGTTTTQRVSATALPQQRALMINANDEDFEAIRKLAEAMDVAAAGSQRKIHVMLLKHVDNVRLAQSLTELYTSAARPNILEDQVNLTAIQGTNAVILAAVPEKLPEVQSLMNQLDVPDVVLGAGAVLRIMPLTHADASRIKGLLDQMYTGESAQAIRGLDKPTVAVDTRTNSLIVSASEKTFTVLELLVKKMDVEVADPSLVLEVVGLKHNDAGVIGPSIQRLFTARMQSKAPQGESPLPQDAVTIETDALANALIISASKENIQLIRELIAKVDVEAPMEAGVVRLFPLKHADAGRVATMLQSLVSQGLYKPGSAQAANAAQAAREKIAIETDTRSNLLIVSASKENFEIIERILEKLDVEQDLSTLADVKLYTLKYADAGNLATILQQFFTAKRSGEQQALQGGEDRSLPVNVTADARTNTLLVTGGPESFKIVDEMIKRLDTEAVATQGEFRIFPLKKATAGALQQTLQTLFDQRVARGVTQDKVTVLADAYSNSLIVGASPADMVLLESLLGKLDVEKPADAIDSTVRIFPLKKGDAVKLSETLKALYQTQAQQSGQPATTTPTVGIVADERMNAIIVTAGPADMTRIEGLIQQLDGQSITRVTEIRIFPLNSADAQELSELLNSTLTEPLQEPTQDPAVRQSLLQIIGDDQGSGEQAIQALQEGVLITPDRRTNSVVVSAPLDYMPLVSRLIKQLDTTKPRMGEIRIVELHNADATQMAEILSQLFKLQAVGTTGTGGATNTANERAVRYTLVLPEKGADGTSAVIGSAEKHALTVTVDTRTNSLLVGGTQENVNLVTDVVAKLDANPGQERTTRIFTLRNAQAADVQTAIRDFLDQERDRLQQALGEEGLGAAQKLLEREVAIVAEPTTSALLVSASPRYFSTIEELILKLDSPKPQVLIQVTLAEVTLTDGMDLGFEWNYTKGFGDVTVQGGTNFGLQQSFNQFGGMGVAVTAGDLSFFLRALQTQGKLEVLSRPQILASDNQPANINIGQRVPFVANSVISDQGNVNNTINYEDVGIILDVTARMTDDGYVHMDIAPEISSIADSTVQISNNLNAIIVDTRSAETSVTVRDGHTIVIGGLITAQDSKIERKVPILGDIPLIGGLFKDTNVSKERRELLIILTPRIIRSVEEADAMTAEQQERFKLLQQTDPSRTDEVLDLKNGQEEGGR